MSSSTEPSSSSLLSSNSDREFLLDDEAWIGGPLHCQWGQLARKIAYECLQQISVSHNHLRDLSNKSDLATGSLGSFAYLQYELSKHCKNEEHRIRLLTSARDFCLQVLDAESDKMAESDIDRLTTSDIWAQLQAEGEKQYEKAPETMSILTNSEIGANLMLTVIYNELGDVYEGRDHLRILLRIWKQANGWNLSHEYGRAGALQGIFFLRRELLSPNGARDLAFEIAKELLVSLNQAKSLCASKTRDGMMPGRIGYLYVLLGLEQEEWDRLEKVVPGCQQKVEGIIELNYLKSVVTDGHDPSLAKRVSGQILLLIRASQVFGKELYLDCAKQYAEEYLLPRSFNTKIGLSDGIAGAALALRYLKEDKAVERLIQVAIQDQSSIEGRECGLFEGMGGLALLLMDMADQIQPLCFPFLHPPFTSNSLSQPTNRTIFDDQDSHTNFRNDVDSQSGNEENRQQFLNSVESAICSPSRQDSKPRPSGNPIQSPNAPHIYDYSSPLKNSPSSSVVPTPRSTPARKSRIPTFSSPASTSVRSQHSNASPSPVLKAALRPTKIPTPAKPISVSLQLSQQTRIRTPPRPLAKSKTAQVSKQASLTEKQSKLRYVDSKSVSNEEKGPNSPPRPNRLGTENRVICEYQFRDRNGKFAQRIMSRCLDGSTAEGNLLNGGIGPCIYLRLQMSKISENNTTHLLKASMIEAGKALKLAEKRGRPPTHNIFSDDFVGAKCLYIILLHRLGRSNHALVNAEDLLAHLRHGCANLPAESCDVLDGRAGVLKTIWFLRSELKSPFFGRTFALHLSKQILCQGMLTAKKYNSDSLVMWEWKSKPYLGGAHGVAGILHALLGHSEEEMKSLESMLPRVKDVILQAIESLDSSCGDSQNLRKKLNDEEDNEMISMVHGSPAHCLLLAKASIVFPEKRKEFLLRATRIADSTLRPTRINNANAGLIRGISGIGYIFLALAQLDLENAPKWISKAETIAHSAVDQLDSLIPNSRRPFSLFEGIGGLASLLFDLLHPESACFPFFDSSNQFEIAGESTNGIETSHPAI